MSKNSGNFHGKFETWCSLKGKHSSFLLNFSIIYSSTLSVSIYVKGLYIEHEELCFFTAQVYVIVIKYSTYQRLVATTAAGKNPKKNEPPPAIKTHRPFYFFKQNICHDSKTFKKWSTSSGNCHTLNELLVLVLYCFIANKTKTRPY